MYSTDTTTLRCSAGSCYTYDTTFDDFVLKHQLSTLEAQEKEAKKEKKCRISRMIEKRRSERSEK